MAINTAFNSYIDEISSYFGGIEVVERLMTQQEMEFLVMFSGFVVCVKSWDPFFDLTEYGYTPGTPYRVFNQNWELVYETSSTSGIFGEQNGDREALFYTPNASYLMIKFETINEPVCGLIWVCSRLSPNQVTNKINEWVQTKKSLRVTQSENELFIDLSNLSQTGYLNIYFLARPWESRVLLTDFDSDEKTTVVRQELTNIITLYPQRSGWYAIAHVIDGLSRIVTLDNVIGSGIRRLKVSEQGYFFIDFTNQNVSAPLIYPNALPTQDTTDSWLSTDNKIRINASGKYAGSEMKTTCSTFAEINIKNSVLLVSNCRSNTFMTYTKPPVLFTTSRSRSVINF